MTVWKTQSVQLVWFADTVNRANFEEMFTTLTGLDVQNSHTSRLPPPQVGMVGSAQASDETFAYNLQFQPGRYDIFITSADPSAPQEAASPRLVMKVEELIANGFVEGIGRVAALSTIGRDAESLPAANKMLRNQSGMLLPEDGDRDFRIQINRRADFEGRSCNRIVNWAVHQFDDLQLTFQPGMLQSPVPVSQSGLKTSISAVFDLNTQPSNQPFSKPEYAAIFQSLAREAFRLSRENSLKAVQ